MRRPVNPSFRSCYNHPMSLFKLKPAQYLIAFSGGVDSTVLLHVAAQLAQRNSAIQLRAIHINHGLSKQADQWVTHCQELCQQLNIPLIIEKVKLQQQKKLGVEAAARKARYVAIAKHQLADEILLTAHHQQDQVETILLHLMRGTGVKGLAGMVQKDQHLRPLLNVSKDDILAYANTEKLKWIEDESNQNLDFSRNKLRHQIIPELAQQWPSVAEQVSKTARHCLEAQQLLDELAQQDLICSRADHCLTLPEQQLLYPGVQLSVEKILELSVARQKNLLRYWLAQQQSLMPSEIKLTQILTEVMLAKEDAQPCVAWENVSVRRYQDLLFCVGSRDGSSHNLEDFYPPLTSEQFTQAQFKTRQGGERLTLPNHEHSSSLKKLLQQWGVPPWQREQLLLAWLDDQLVAVNVKSLSKD